jgi:hypothetical protein
VIFFIYCRGSKIEIETGTIRAKTGFGSYRIEYKNYSSSQLLKGLLVLVSDIERCPLMHTRNNNGKAAGNAHDNRDDAEKPKEWRVVERDSGENKGISAAWGLKKGDFVVYAAQPEPATEERCAGINGTSTNYEYWVDSSLKLLSDFDRKSSAH